MGGPVFRPLAQLKGQDTFISHFARIMAVNEGGHGRAAYAINHAKTEHSSWSFGNHQYDISGNKNGAELMRDILLHATDSAGSPIVHSELVDDFMSRMRIKGDPESISYDERLLINSALQSQYGMDVIDADFMRYASTIENKVKAVIDSVQASDVKGYLMSHIEAQLFIADIKNQFGYQVNVKLVEFLQGNTVQLPAPGGEVAIDYPFGFEDLSAFAAATAYAQKPRGASDLARRQTNILDEISGNLKLASEGGKLKAKELLFTPKDGSLINSVLSSVATPKDLTLKQSLLTSAIEDELAQQIRKHVEAAANEARPRDPLALDLDGSGAVESLEESGTTYFDFEGDGFAESVGWVGPSDGFVVRDLNGNGTIDSGAELFGDETVLPDGTRAADGFHALTALDSNGDDVVNIFDGAWAQLKVWKDLDSDGQTDAGELLAMVDAGVAGINLSAATSGTVDGQGNVVSKLGSYVRTDGSAATASSFVFPRDTTNAAPSNAPIVSSSIRQLPELSGFGQVYSLQETMAQHPGLENLVRNFTSSTNYANMREDFEAILFTWTGSAEVEQDSRGPFIDARKLAVVEAFYGQPYIGTEGPNPFMAAAAKLSEAYSSIFESFYVQLLSDTKLSSVWDAVYFDFDDESGELIANYHDAVTVLSDLLGPQPGASVYLLYEFARSATELERVGNSNMDQLAAQLDSSMTAYHHVVRAAADGKLLKLGSAANETFTMTSAGVAYGLGGLDLITGSAGDDTVIGGADVDGLYGSAGNDYLYGQDGNDTLDGGAGDDVLAGGGGDDRLIDSEGSNIFDGGDGNDVMGAPTTTAFWGPSTYVGGKGDDTNIGSRGADTYVFESGDGSDIIRENPYNAGGDVLEMGEGLTPTDWSVSRVGSDLLMVHASNADKIRFASWFDSVDSKAYRVDRVAFVDGTVWTAAELTERALTVYGTAGADNLKGLDSTNDIISSLEGNDIISGLAGSDKLMGDAGDDQLYGGKGDDTLFGGDGADYLNGEAGNDYLSGGAGVDRLYDTEGANTFDGGDGNDILMSGSTTAFFGPNIYIGGRGNDTIYGSRGSDTYVFNIGDGQDILRENLYSAGGDVVKFGFGIHSTDWTVTRVGTGLVLSDSQGLDKITLEQWFDSADLKAYRVDRFEFADGTTWTNAELTERALSVSGTNAGEVLKGLSNSNDIIRGLDGDDTIFGFAGTDRLYGDGGADTLYGGDGTDALYGGDGADYLDGEAGDDYLSGGAGADRLYDTAGVNTFDGGDGNDWLMSAATTAFFGPNTYIGGRGDDTIFGSRGGDTYIFDIGDGSDLLRENQYGSGTDTVKFGIGLRSADLAASRLGNSLVLSHANGSDKLTFQDWFYSPNSTQYQIERFEFADGAVFTGSEIAALVGAASLDNTISASLFVI